MNEDMPERVTLDASTISNREWLWLEDSCGVVATSAQAKPMRSVLAFKTLALRRWETTQGRPPKITFDNVVDGTFDDVKFDIEGGEPADPPAAAE